MCQICFVIKFFFRQIINNESLININIRVYIFIFN